MSHRILLIDDEDDILEFIRYNLTKAGYEVYTARNGAEGLQQAAAHRPHLILLDMMMPVMDGIETCRALRRDPALKETMVVFLSALGEEEQQLAGFGAGADDYIPKPIKPKLLLSRIQAILKRVAADKPASLVIDRERHLVIRDGERIELPRKEFALLALLASSPGKLFSREEIYSPYLGRYGGRRRPYDRCPRPQNPAKNRKRTYLDRKGVGLQIRKLTTDNPKFITKIPKNLTIRN